MFILSIAIAPVLALVVYFYRKDKHEKEPLELLLGAFFGGMVIIFFALIFESVLMFFVEAVNIFVIRIFLEAFLVAAFVEEGLKFCVFRRIIYKNKEFNEPYDGILYAVMISLGFAALENIKYAIVYYFKLGFLA